MPMPSECKMSDLSDLVPLWDRLTVQLLVGLPGLSKEAGRCLRNFVRLIEKALIEHHEAREIMLKMIGHPERYFMLFEFINHIETCINAVRRLYKLLDRINAEKESPYIPRELRRLVESHEIAIKNVRNTSEHMDNIIQDKPVMLTVSEDNVGVIVSDYKLKFNELDIVLRKMHEVAEYILSIKKIERQKGSSDTLRAQEKRKGG